MPSARLSKEGTDRRVGQWRPIPAVPRSVASASSMSSQPHPPPSSLPGWEFRQTTALLETSCLIPQHPPHCPCTAVSRSWIPPVTHKLRAPGDFPWAQLTGLPVLLWLRPVPPSLLPGSRHAGPSRANRHSPTTPVLSCLWVPPPLPALPSSELPLTFKMYSGL